MVKKSTAISIDLLVLICYFKMTEYYDFSNGRRLKHNFYLIADQMCGIVIPFCSVGLLFHMLKMDSKILSDLEIWAQFIIFGISVYTLSYSLIIFPIKTSVIAIGLSKIMFAKNSDN